MASRGGDSLCPPLSHYTDSSLISHKGNQPPHEFGHCSPLGPGQTFFYNSANDAKIFFSVINLINILIMTWGWQSNQIVRRPVVGPHLHFGDKFSQVSRAVIQWGWTSYQCWAHSWDNFLCVIIKWWLSGSKQLPLYSRNLLTFVGFVQRVSR